ncbi:MAG: glycosyltransferase family 39 protein [Anaerolineales bacterium]
MGFTVRTFSLDAQGLWRDEVDSLRFATAPWAELLDTFIRPGWNGPFYFLMLRGWVALAGETGFALRYLSLLWGVLGIPLLYQLGQRLLNREVGLWAALLMAFSPYLVWYAQEVRMYTWVPFLVLLALYALDRAAVRPRWYWWAIVSVATSLAFYSHILAALLIPVEVLFFLLHPRRHRRAWIGGLIVLILLTLPYLPLVHWQLPLVFEERQTGYPPHTLGEMTSILASGWTTGMAVARPFWLDWLGLSLMSALSVVGLLALFLGRRESCGWRQALTLLAWWAVPLAAIWWVSLRGPIFTDRYLIWTAPAFYLAVAVGVVFLGRVWRHLPTLLLLVILIVDGVNLYQQLVVPIKPQFREATAYLEEHRNPDTLLLFQIPYNHFVVDYYGDGALEPWAGAPFTNWRTPEGDYQVSQGSLALQMQDLTEVHDEIWLVYSEATMWDDRELVKWWLDAHGVLLDEKHFYLVELYHYALPENR